MFNTHLEEANKKYIKNMENQNKEYLINLKIKLAQEKQSEINKIKEVSLVEQDKLIKDINELNLVILGLK